MNIIYNIKKASFERHGLTVQPWATRCCSIAAAIAGGVGMVQGGSMVVKELRRALRSVY